MFKKILNGKIVIILIILSPLIDIITSIMTYNGINLTLGLFTKVIVLIFATLYLLLIDKSNKKINYLLIGLLFIHNILNIINNIGVIKTEAFSYFGYLMKFDFMIIMLLFFIKYFKQNKFDIKLLKIPILIIGLSLIISNLTNTAFPTYDAIRSGTSSWFTSANEFGAVLSIAYPIAIYLFLDKKYSKKIDIIYVLLMAYGLIQIGTKVGILSFYISSIAYVILRLINIKKYKLNYAFYVILTLVLITTCCYSNLPVVKNIEFKYNYIIKENEALYTEEELEEYAKENIITSDRDKFLEYIQNIYYDNFDYIIGKSNIKDNEILLIESDIFDMYYMFGIYGFILIYGIVLYIIIILLSKYKENFISGLKYTKINMLVVCIGLIFLISTLAGHVILCPSVSIYVALICGYLVAYDKFEKEDNSKKKILIGGVHLQIGGIESTLINLLKLIDYDKYEVDLMILLKNGELLKEVPKEVKIITPYSEELTNFFAKESYISKIFKHILFNKYTAFMWTNNKAYDVAINYTGYYLFTDYYIANSKSNKKFIWVHQNVYGTQKYDKNFENKFTKHIKKYKKYKNIVCVSDSSKEAFDKMFPEYNQKTLVINNILDDKVRTEKKVALKGNYKIISIGRICPQKGFERLIDVHKKLIDEGYNINTYLIGGGKDADNLKSLIKEKEIETSLELIGPKYNIGDYLKECDLLVSTSHTEAYPTVLFESLICKTPWVGPNVPGIKDVYKVSPKNSCILTEDTIEGIAKGIKDAIKGKINNQFKFDVASINAKTLRDFYNLIGG